MDSNANVSTMDRFSFKRDFLKILLVALAYFLAHDISFFFPDSKNVLMLIWPAGGIGLAAFLLNRRQLWPYLTLAFYMAGITADVFIAHRTFWSGVGFMTSNMVESIASAWLILSFAGKFQKFDRIGEVLALMVGVLMINALSACIGAYTSVVSNGGTFTESWQSWYIADGLGMLLVGTFLVSWSSKVKSYLHEFDWKKILEVFSFILLFSLFIYIIFYEKKGFFFGAHPYMLVFLLIWQSLRFGIKGVTLTLLILFIASIGSPAIVDGPSPWGELHTDSIGRILELQLFIALLAIIGYLMSASYTSLSDSQKSLRESDERFRNLIKNLPSGVVVHGKDTSIQMSNVMAESILGLTSDQLRGKTAMDPSWQFLHEDGTPMPHNEYPVNLVLASGEGFRNKIIGRQNQSDEEVVWALCNAYPMNGKDGKIRQVVVTFNDITALKHTELELIKSKEKAEKSDRLKSAFLANMSHEIRTPMNGILGFAELLKEPNLSGKKQQEYIRIIDKSGARMLNLINDIVDISKIEAGLMEVHLTESNINDQIDFIYTFFKPEVESKGLTFSINKTLSSKEALIHTDFEKLLAILTNLVKNAQKFTNKGSIAFGYEKKGNYLEFFVKDTGIGIPEKMHETIFERFIQAENTTRKTFQGVGLGLAISKSYIKMLGGKIWVESEEGVGSTFYFTIPYHAESQGVIPTKETFGQEGVENHPKTLKILLVEDDETSKLLISIVVKAFSKEILIAGNGVEAVELCRSNPDLDLILMDIRMPEMGGYEATRQIRTFNKDVIIIAQTAYALSGDREKALHAGCTDYTTKPINKEGLGMLIQKYLQ